MITKEKWRVIGRVTEYLDAQCAAAELRPTWRPVH